MKYQIKWKELGIDVIVDIIASMLIAVGIYNFALNANFPVAGFSGIAIILYHLFGLPVGAGTLLLNVPVAIFCYKTISPPCFRCTTATGFWQHFAWACLPAQGMQSCSCAALPQADRTSSAWQSRR